MMHPSFLLADVVVDLSESSSSKALSGLFLLDRGHTSKALTNSLWISTTIHYDVSAQLRKVFHMYTVAYKLDLGYNTAFRIFDASLDVQQRERN